jgi:NAD-dependent aldehyde dehydrogenases
MKNLKMFINGKFVENVSDKWINVLNPSTEEVISLMPDGTADDVKAAIDAAEKAQPAWEKIPAVERAKYLRIIANGIQEKEKLS